jgi:photosystem II stability/assembly factor-like uncharacterized protein
VDLDSLYVSNDAGTSWTVLALPDGFSFTSHLACSDAKTCAGGGVLDSKPVFISTTDGGHQWTIKPISFSDEIVALTCVSASTCNGIAAPASVIPEIDLGGLGGDAMPDEVFVQTTDGGNTWSTGALPVDDFIAGMTCSSSTSCVAIGYSAITNPSGFALETSNAGASWSNGSLPSGLSFAYVSKLSCGDARHCMALGFISNPLVTGIITTSDGGATWDLQRLPSEVRDPQMWDVSCSSAEQCWVAGEEAVPRSVGKAIDYGSSVVLGTIDGGATWSKTTFVVPAGAPNDIGGDAYMAVGTISCPSANVCVALGASDQGSTNTPVYSNVAP